MNKAGLIGDIQAKFKINPVLARRLLAIANPGNIFQHIEQMLDDKPKPFVKWVGGKRQLLKQFRLMNLYPPEGFNPSKNRYFEPFVGGGAVFFDLLPAKAFLSDLNAELVVTYNVIKNKVDLLISDLKRHEHDKEYFLKIRAQSPENLSDVKRASRFIYLNRTGFNGMYRVNSRGQFNVPFGKYKNPLICDEDNLRKAAAALQNVQIENRDYKIVLEKARKGDFVYFDPPYYPVSKTASFTSYTKESFLEKEQLELRDTFLDLTKRGCFVMLSNSDAPFVNQIYTELKKYGVRITKVDAGRAINSNSAGRGKIKEVLVTNY